MRISSIDDAVEHWIFNASSFLARVQKEDWRSGQFLASHRRALLFPAYIAIGSFFTPLVLFAIVLVPVLIVRVADLIREVSIDRT